ncbi:Glycosyl transferase [Macleaya cordata]|uniref:Fucosyltransferase n=1 Tax=Macleaya cordata TaxID=56857 RepID=A0A200QYY5_MACCD|nr:Glycosyl transferase [Macleaya cordata]
MGVVTGQRGTSRTGTTTPHEEHISVGVGVGVSSSATNNNKNNNNNNKKKWSNLMPLIVALVVVVEIAFLGRLDMAKNAAMVHTWTNSFYYTSLGSEALPSPSQEDPPRLGLKINNNNKNDEQMTTTHSISRDVEICEAWLEREDAISYSRDFHKQPIWISGAEQDWDSCSVGCKFGYKPETNTRPDAAIGLPEDGVAGILRSMESSHYYAENNVALARRRGYKVVMTTSLSSDVPVGYFSWAEYDIMAPLQPKTEAALAAAFISNCGARNFRLQALEMLEKSNVKIDSYGGCHRNRDGRAVDKVDALKHYKFSLAFENSNEEDYVTEKFFQSLVAGSVPVVVGAPNILDFAPSPGSVLHIKELDDVPSVAKTMKYLAENPDAYNQTVRWKYDGPSDSFKALVDMAAVHSSCRLCIHLATKIWETEERRPGLKKRPCKCTRGLETVYHLYVRERGRFQMDSIFLRSGNVTLEALESVVLAKFKSLNHVPIWKQERPERIRGGDELKVYRIYPVGMTQRQALYTFRFKGDSDLRSYLERNPCAKFEVIFV